MKLAGLNIESKCGLILIIKFEDFDRNLKICGFIMKIQPVFFPLGLFVAGQIENYIVSVCLIQSKPANNKPLRFKFEEMIAAGIAKQVVLILIIAVCLKSENKKAIAAMKLQSLKKIKL